MLRAVKRFIQTVLLILLSPFVLFLLGLVLSIVLLDDFLNDDDRQNLTAYGAYGVPLPPLSRVSDRQRQARGYRAICETKFSSRPSQAVD